MMLSLYLLIRDSFVLSLPDGKKVTIRDKERETNEHQITVHQGHAETLYVNACHSEGRV